MRVLILCATLLSVTSEIGAQTLPYARSVVETLSSDEFKGRGYVHDGDKLAADFIKKEFERFGLQPIGGDYYQEFELPINTFPTEVNLSVNGNPLIPGKEFVVTPGSGPLKGSFETISITADDMLSDDRFLKKVREAFAKLVVVQPYDKSDYAKEEQDRLNMIEMFLKYHDDNPILGSIFLSEEPLKWNGSQQQYKRASVEVFADSIDTPINEVELTINPEFIESYKTQNVIGYLEGDNTDSLIVIMAHYDHFGMMGNAIFPGANDNASGTAMMLSLARYFSENKPPYSMVFMAFGGEELGLLGSKYFIQNPTIDLKKIKFMMNFDLAGTGDEGIQVVNGSVYRNEFDRLSELNSENDLLPQVKIRGAACNSDHCFFSEMGIPGFYIYTLGGIRAYHDVYDRYETLPFTEFEDYFKLMTEFIDQL